MKRIICYGIKPDTNTTEDMYVLEQESFPCDYSEDWFKDANGADMIKDYVESSIENWYDNVYTWDEDVNLNYGWVVLGEQVHVLFRNGVPIELYTTEDVKESKDEQEEVKAL